METGVSLILAGSRPMAEVLSRVASAGFAQVEFSCYDNPAGRWWRDPSAARAALREAGLVARTVHSPDAGWNNDAPDDAVRRASIDATSAIFDAAREAGVETVVVHPNTPDTHTFVAEEFEIHFARAADSIARLARRARDADIRIAVENMPMRHLPRPGGRIADTLRMIDALGDHVGVCFDVGHSNANVADPAAEIRLAGGKIFCVHIQDNDGRGEDQHLIPGEGTVDWPRVLDALDRCAPQACLNFEIGLKDPGTGVDRDLDDLLATLAALRRQWTGK